MNAILSSLVLSTLAHPVHRQVAGNAAGGFSVHLPIGGRVRGATAFFTALAATTNSAQSTEVEFEYVPADGSAPRSGLLGTLAPLDNLHLDDFLKTLADAGLLPPGPAATPSPPPLSRAAPPPPGPPRPATATASARSC